MFCRPKTELLFEESARCMPGGVSSPVRAFRDLGLTPLVVERGERENVIDVDGHSFVDYCMSYGALILGHAHPAVVEAVQHQVGRGTTFGIATRLEKEMAERLSLLIPSMEKVRFVSSGTEATMSAVRLARGYTGKTRLVKCRGGYHGHADPFLVQGGSGLMELTEASSLGVPQGAVATTLSLPYNDVDAVREAFSTYKDIAAFIVEPVAANMGLVPASKEYLEVLREETEKAGALLIFDEVVTGFRFCPGGMQQQLGIEPDLTCLGKIVGGGLPAAVFGGRREIMDCLAPLGGVYQAGTLSGNPLAMSAGLAVLSEVMKPGFYEELEEKASCLLEPIERLIRDRDLPLCLHRKGSCFTLFLGVKKVESQEDLKGLDASLFRAFYHHLFARGIHIPPSQQEVSFLSSAHSPASLQKTQEALYSFLIQL